MHDVHLPAFDLNLLVALDALLREQSVTRAAGRVGISQSAMSHALSRLRAVTGDPLLVRAKTGMVPTTRAEALGPPIRRALADVAGALAKVPPFEPRTSQAKITLGTSDYGELVLLPRLAARLAREAPGIDLRVRAHGEDVSGQLASGEMDLVVAPVRSRDDAPAIFARQLVAERFVCVVRKGHALAGKKLTLARYVASSHVLIAPRETEGGFVDDALARMGMKRRVAVMVPHFLIAPHVVAATDLICTVAARVAHAFAKPLGLAILIPPPELKLAGFSISAVWHERTQNDPAQRWIRALFAEVAKTS